MKKKCISKSPSEGVPGAMKWPRLWPASHHQLGQPWAVAVSSAPVLCLLQAQALQCSENNVQAQNWLHFAQAQEQIEVLVETVALRELCNQS